MKPHEATTMEQDLKLAREALLKEGVPAHPQHPLRIALEAIERQIAELDLQGDPKDLANKVFSLFILPALKAASKDGPQNLALMYVFLLTSITVALMADLGKEVTMQVNHDLSEFISHSEIIKLPLQ